MKTVSCVIPAYNESERIARVLEAVHRHPLVTEIIVVDDGSTDIEITEEIVGKFDGVRLIKNHQNQGKSKNLYVGLKEITGEYIFMLDADLIGLTAADITLLMEPVLSGKVDMTLSMRKNSPWVDRKIGLDFFSGERVFHRSILDGYIEEIPKLSRFGVETFLNSIVMEKKYSLAIIFWPDVVSPFKISKWGLSAGIAGEVKMVVDICRVMPLHRVLYMFYQMRSLIKIPHKK